MKSICLLLLLFVLSGRLAAQATATADSNATRHGLPVLRSYVAPDVVERAKKKFGRALYSLEKSTAAGCENSYLVGLIQRGRLAMQWMCDDEKMVRMRNKTLNNFPAHLISP